jgi:protoporphyrinogen oxidase
LQRKRAAIDANVYGTAEEVVEYDRLISTVPLDRLAAMCSRPVPDLLHSSTYIVGVGICGEAPRDIRYKSWMYYPESDCPFYRVTVFSNYSPNNAPPGCYSLMAEVSESEYKPVELEWLVNDVVQGMVNTGLIERADSIVSTWNHRLEYGYPVPSLGRDAALASILPTLESYGVRSCGRFGGWRYEVSNQDHSYQQGRDAVCE